MSVSRARLREVAAIVARAAERLDPGSGVQAVVVVGSYAYGRPTEDSDVDLVIAVEDREAWLADQPSLTAIAGTPAELVREQDWGPLREQRYRTSSGLEVELGLVTARWFATPVDPGTAKVLRDGCRVVTDPDGLAKDALTWLGLTTRTWTALEDSQRQHDDAW